LIQLGIYQHYKGKLYQVLGIARHTETSEELVVYRALYEDGLLWARPVALFKEKILQDGQEIARFKFVAETNSCSST